MRATSFMPMVVANLSGINLQSSPDAQRFKALVECSLDAIFLTDFDSAQFVEVNEKACELFGYTAAELTGKTGRQLHPPATQALVDEISRELINNGSVWRPSVTLQRKDGSLFPGELRSHCYVSEGRALYITFVRDLSAQDSRERELQEAYRHLRETQDQLVHTARLAAIGQLAAGIAHEVNNPAAYVFSNLEALYRSIDQLSGKENLAAQDTLQEFRTESKENLSDCLEGLGRIAAIVRGLKAFARIDSRDIKLTSLNDVVHAAVNLLKPQTRHIAQVELDLRSEIKIAADRGKLVQVVVNLVMNAAQAIDEEKGSRIKIVTYDLADGILLTVEDDGPGVSSAVSARVFEPFFTTKSSEGTGLGLSLCIDILGQHNATIRLDETTKQGARFEVFLPCETGLIEHRTEVQQLSGPRIQRLRMLVVDDEVALIRAYRRALGQQHEIIAAYNGQEALDTLMQNNPFDVIICDLMMPVMDGMALFEKVLEFDPALASRFIFCTGGPSSERAQQFVANRKLIVLEKPFGQALLNDALIKALENHR